MTKGRQDWQRLPIEVIAKLHLGGNYKNVTLPSSRPLIKMGNIARINIDLSKIEYIPESESVDPGHRLEYGDILLNTRNTLELVGKVSIWRNELPCAYFNSNILRFEFNCEYCGDSQYFGYALNSKESIESIRALATGTTSVAAVYSRDLLKLTVPVPPKHEQRAIAEALTDADNLIAALKRMITKKQAIKQGLMQQLLTAKRRLPQFQASWKEVRLLDLVSIRNGQVDPRRPGYRDLPLIAPDHIESGTGRLLKVETARAQGAISGKYFAAPGDIIYSKIRPYLKKVVLVDFPALCSADAYPLTPRSDVHGPFMLYTLLGEQFTDFATSVSMRSGIPKINRSELSEFVIDVPGHLEQRAIAQVLADTDNEIEALNHRLTKAKSVKQGMMQELLTGRTRLPVQEVAS